MDITISIDDSVAPDLLQNAALSLGMNDVTDEEVRKRLGQDFARNMITLARDGQTLRKRNAEQAELDAAVAKVSVK